MDLEHLSFPLKEWDRVEYYRCRINQNYGGGNNIGLRMSLDAGAHYVLIANPDTWFESNAIERLLSIVQSNPDYGILSALQLDYNSNDVSHLAQQCVRVSSEDSAVVDTEWTEGSCMLMSRRLIETIGGFDLLYEMYYEDVDLCRRARLAGFKIGVVPDARYHHHSNASFGGKTNADRVARIDCSQFKFLLTDPRYSWEYNELRAIRWLAARTGLWCLGRRPEFGAALRPIINEYAVNRRRLKDNWRLRRSGELRVPLPDDLGSLLVTTSDC